MPWFRALRTGQYGGCLRKEGTKFHGTDKFARQLEQQQADYRAGNKRETAWAKQIEGKEPVEDEPQEDGGALSDDKPESEGPRDTINDDAKEHHGGGVEVL